MVEPACLDGLVRPFHAKYFPAFRTVARNEADMDLMASVIDPAWNELLPTTYLVGRDGRVVKRIQGKKTLDEFRALVLPLLGWGRLPMGENPFAWAVAPMLIALCSTCLGVLISTLARTEGQVSGISNALLWVAGFLGGAIFPAVFLQQIPFMNIVMKLVPQSWAITAYYDVLTRGKGLVDIWPNLLVILGFSVAFFAIGVSRFKFE